MQSVGAWLGQNLNAAEAELGVLSRKGIIVNSDFSNRILGRYGIVFEAIDQQLRTKGPSRAQDQSAQHFLQPARAVRQTIEALPPQDNGTAGELSTANQGIAREHRDLFLLPCDS